MAEITFQKLYQVSIGQFTSTGRLSPILKLTKHRFKANIAVTAKKATTTNPTVSTIDIYNLSPEVLETFSGATNLYIEIKAGYLQDNGVKTIEDLPTVYLGSVFHSYSSNPKNDLITKFSCIPYSDKASTARCNRTFTAKSSVKSVLDYIVGTMGMTVDHQWGFEGEQKTRVLLKDRTVEGPSNVVLEKWCDRYGIRAVSDKGIVKLINKELFHTTKIRHKIPLQRTKGYPSVSLDLANALKEKTAPVPDVTLRTFLYPRVELNESLSIELIDYSSPQVKGQYQTKFQDFIVTSYQHQMDSHEGASWTTTITGKGSQL